LIECHFMGYGIYYKGNIGLNFSNFTKAHIYMLVTPGIFTVNGDSIFPFFEKSAFLLIQFYVFIGIVCACLRSHKFAINIHLIIIVKNNLDYRLGYLFL